MNNLIGISGKIGAGKDTVGKIIQGLSVGEDKFVDGIVGFLEYYNDIDESITPLPYQIKKFAFKLKLIASILTGFPVKDFESQDFKNSYLGKIWDKGFNKTENLTKYELEQNHNLTPEEAIQQGWEKVHENSYSLVTLMERPLTVREFLQKLGTEAMRNQIHPNVWVNALFADYIADTGFQYQVKKVGESIVTGEQQLKVVSEPKPYDFGYPNWIITDVRFPNEAQAILDRGGIVIRVNRPKAWHNSDIVRRDLQTEHPSETALDNWKFNYVIDNSSDIPHLIEEVKTFMNYLNQKERV